MCMCVGAFRTRRECQISRSRSYKCLRRSWCGCWQSTLALYKAVCQYMPLTAGPPAQPLPFHDIVSFSECVSQAVWNDCLILFEKKKKKCLFTVLMIEHTPSSVWRTPTSYIPRLILWKWFIFILVMCMCVHTVFVQCTCSVHTPVKATKGALTPWSGVGGTGSCELPDLGVEEWTRCFAWVASIPKCRTISPKPPIHLKVIYLTMVCSKVKKKKRDKYQSGCH